MKNGVLSFCKICVKLKVMLYRKKNIQKIREYDRNRPNKIERQERNKKNAYKYLSKKYEYLKRYRDKFPDKAKARDVTFYALKSGKIKKFPCEVCGNKKSEAHHDDYSKPLKVKWLCPIHHADLHKKLRKLSPF